MPLNLSDNATLKDIQEEINRLRRERNFSMDRLHIMMLLLEETAELCCQIRRTYVDHIPALPSDNKSSIQHEMADVFILLNALAKTENIDLETAWRSKEAINDARDWKKPKQY